MLGRVLGVFFLAAARGVLLGNGRHRLHHHHHVVHEPDKPGDMKQYLARKPKEKQCALTPTYVNDFPKAVQLLRTVKEKAQDEVPFFVVVTTAAEAETFKELANSSKDALAPHRVLAFENITPPEDGEFKNVMWKIDTSANWQKTGCRKAGTPSRLTGHMKKLYGIRHLALVEHCDVVWVLDCESMPMRSFSYDEIFSRLGMLWVHDQRRIIHAQQQTNENRWAGVGPWDCTKDRDLAPCMRAAENTHGVKLSGAVQAMNLRVNDFWLYETKLVLAMFQDAARRFGPNATFLDAFRQGGQNSEQLVWMSWLAQRVDDGSVWDLHPRVKYELITIADKVEEFMRVGPSNMSLTRPPTHVLTKLPKDMPTLNMEEFGRFWYGSLGQAGVWGHLVIQLEKLAQERNSHRGRAAGLPYLNITAFYQAVPWCVSNCPITDSHGELIPDFVPPKRKKIHHKRSLEWKLHHKWITEEEYEAARHAGGRT